MLPTSSSVRSYDRSYPSKTTPLTLVFAVGGIATACFSPEVALEPGTESAVLTAQGAGG